MTKTVRILFALICTALVVGIPGYYMEPLVVVRDAPIDGWMPILHLNHNAYHMWRIDHLSRLSYFILSPSYSVQKPFTPLLILFLGTYLFMRRLDGSYRFNRVTNWAMSLLPLLMLLDVVGLDPLVLGTLAWVPLMALVCLRLFTQSAPSWWWLLLALVSLENTLSANQAAIISGSIALFLASVVTKRNDTTKVPSTRFRAVMAVLLVPAILTAIFAPSPPIPDYPKGAHVVPDSDIKGMQEPLVGATYAFDPLHLQDVQSLYGPVALYMLALGALALILARRSSSRSTSSYAIFSVMLCMVAVLDTILPEELAAIAPVASVSRLLPHGTHYSLTSICVGLAGWLIGIVCVALPIRLFAWPIGLVSIYTISLSSPELYNPILRRFENTSDPDIKKILSSPSASVIRHYATTYPELLHDLASFRIKSRRPWKDVTELGASISISPESSPEALKVAKQAEKYWRWSSRKGRQEGDELLTVRFPQPTAIQGIELDPGNYFTDFPRGLRIRGGACEDQNSREIVRADSWQGSVVVTPRGYPYLTPRNQVKLRFRETHTVSCLFVHQTGRASFDWSVSRVRVNLAEDALLQSPH